MDIQPQAALFQHSLLPTFQETWRQDPGVKIPGGAERDRTVDPLLAKQVLSQLSYSPTSAASSIA